MNWTLFAVCMVVGVAALVHVGTTESVACDTNECASNGVCMNDTVTGVINCTCADGSDGCYADSDVCDVSPCLNGGQCTPVGDGTFTCLCATGYEGDLCQTDTDDCAATPCLNNGTCTDDVGGFLCQCAEGFTGDTCDTAITAPEGEAEGEAEGESEGEPEGEVTDDDTVTVADDSAASPAAVVSLLSLGVSLIITGL